MTLDRPRGTAIIESASGPLLAHFDEAPAAEIRKGARVSLRGSFTRGRRYGFNHFQAVEMRTASPLQSSSHPSPCSRVLPPEASHGRDQNGFPLPEDVTARLGWAGLATTDQLDQLFYSSDEQLLVARGFYGEVTVFRVDSKKLVYRIQRCPDCRGVGKRIQRVPDRNAIAMFDCGSLSVYELPTGKRILERSIPDLASTFCVDAHADWIIGYRRIYPAGPEPRISFELVCWSLADGSERWVLPTDRHIGMFELSPSGRYLTQMTKRRGQAAEFLVRKTSNGEIILRHQSSGTVSSSEFSATFVRGETQVIVNLGRQEGLASFDLATGERHEFPPDSRGSWRALDSRHGEIFMGEVFMDQRGTLRRTEDLSVVAEFGGSLDQRSVLQNLVLNNRSAAFAPGRKQLAIGQNSIYLLDQDPSGKLRFQPRGGHEVRGGWKSMSFHFTKLRVLPDGRVVSRNWDGDLSLWDREGKRQEAFSFPLSNRASPLGLSRSARSLHILDKDRNWVRISLSDGRTETLWAEVPRQGALASCAEVLLLPPDSDHVGMRRILPGQENSKVFPIPELRHDGLKLSPDGKHALVIGKRHAELWNLEMGRSIHRFENCFSADFLGEVPPYIVFRRASNFNGNSMGARGPTEVWSLEPLAKVLEVQADRFALDSKRGLLMQFDRRGSLGLHSLKDGKQWTFSSATLRGTYSLDLSAAAGLVATSHAGGVAYLWNTSKLMERATPRTNVGR
jgi:WD40 repeat protein